MAGPGVPEKPWRLPRVLAGPVRTPVRRTKLFYVSLGNQALTALLSTQYVLGTELAVPDVLRHIVTKSD